VKADQTTGSGAPGNWYPLGLVPWAPNEDHRVEVQGDVASATVADALAVAADPIRATWTPPVPVTDTYDISVWWPTATGQSAAVTYLIYHAGGTSRVTVDQTQSGGQWNMLGPYVLQPGQNHRVVVPNHLDGETAADAVKFTATGSSTPRLATWALPVTTTNTYDA